MNGFKPALARLAGLRLRAIAALAGALACVALPGGAAAQTRSVETAAAPARALVVTRLSFINSSDMDFGRIAPRATAGTVTISPVTGTCSTTGGLLRIGACEPAEFAGMGSPRLIARVKLNQTSTTLTGPGAPMVLDTFTIDGSPSFVYVGPGQGFSRYRITDPSGIFTFRVGAGSASGPTRRPASIRAASRCGWIISSGFASRTAMPAPHVTDPTAIPPPDTTVVDSARVRCDGAAGIRGAIAPALGHPRVWLEIDEKGFVDCGYCDHRFVLRGGPAETSLREVSPGQIMPERVAQQG